MQPQTNPEKCRPKIPNYRQRLQTQLALLYLVKPDAQLSVKDLCNELSQKPSPNLINFFPKMCLPSHSKLLKQQLMSLEPSSMASEKKLLPSQTATQKLSSKMLETWEKTAYVQEKDLTDEQLEELAYTQLLVTGLVADHKETVRLQALQQDLQAAQALLQLGAAQPMDTTVAAQKPMEL